MKAARLHGFERTHGSSEIVRVDDVPIPDLATGEVLIRVLRAGLNHGDLHMREDAVQYSPEVKTVPDLPMTIGHDGLGEVVEVGSGCRERSRRRPRRRDLFDHLRLLQILPD